MSEILFRFVLDWIGLHLSALVPLLGALVPILALCVAGYAIHVVGRGKGRRK
ncbi:MAG TPA: hypothetical protein VFB63_08255 [Bryobacteraceae bacterium]|nr:hypothetical protein [Bryobacteraceae bacterium]